MYEQYWTKFHSEKLGKFDVVSSWNYEDIPIADCFDGSCYDIEDLERKVYECDLHWFVLRVQVFLNGAEIGCDYLGGNMYENIEDVLTDGVYDDVKYQALEQAKKWMKDVFDNNPAINYIINPLFGELE